MKKILAFLTLTSFSICSCVPSDSGTGLTGNGGSSGNWIKTGCDLLVLASDIASYINKFGGDAVNASAAICKDFQARQVQANATLATGARTEVLPVAIRPGATVKLNVNGVTIHGIVQPK
ncbi:hypothetical protein ACU8V1_25775 (plasmid) [Rhizobium leguminosarum]